MCACTFLDVIDGACIHCIGMQAYRRNYTYPRYAWITYHWYPREWWTDQVTGNVQVNCTEKELQEFLDRVITLQSYPIEENENATTDEETV